MQDALHVTKGMQSHKQLCVASQFPEEPERDQFVFKGRDLFKRLREEVIKTKEAFQDFFKTPIPVLDVDGKLIQAAQKPKK